MIGQVVGSFVLFLIFGGLATSIALLAVVANRAIKEKKDE